MWRTARATSMKTTIAYIFEINDGRQENLKNIYDKRKTTTVVSTDSNEKS